MRISPALVLGSLASSLAAQRVAEIEPNGSAAQAQVVAPGSQVDAALAAGETDWYRFTTAGGNVRVFTHGPTELDTVIELRDGAGTALLAIDDDSAALFSALSLNVPAGTYTVKVTGWSGATAGGYQIEFGELAPVAANGAESEPNDSVATADPIALGATIDGALASGTDQDWYRITLTAPRTGLWLLIGEGDAPWVSNHRWEVYDGAGVLLAPTSTYGQNAGNSSSSALRTSQIRCWPAGTYHVVVRNSTAPFGYGLLVPQGNYRLQLVAMPMATGATVVESEPNNTVATATPLAVGGRASAAITVAAGADPVDVFGPFVFTTPGVIQYQTMQGASGALLDSTIRLLDEDENVLVTSTVGNTLSGTSHGRGTVSFAVAPATFYLEVSSPGGLASQAGSYFLEIGASVPPYVVASYSLDGVNAGCLGSNALRPTLSVDSPGEAPVLGTNLSRKIGSLPPFAPFLLVEGLSNQFANGVVPLPYDLGVHGAPGCTLNVDPLSVLLYLGSPSGEAWLNSLQANSVVFRGLLIYEQVMVLDTGANVLGLTASNYARRLFGERNW